MIDLLKKIIPKKIFRRVQPIYHYILALLGAVIYRFPGKKIVVIGVTGTKGKSTTTELINIIFETAGYKTALQNTIRFKINEKAERNLYKMTMPGRFFIQKFLREAVDGGCQIAILELTSEGAKQFRHKFINLDVLIFTNLAPEHIESHGSYENYVNAKLSIARELEGGKKKVEKFSFYEPAIIVNKDDKEAEKFLSLKIKNKITYSLSDAFNIKTNDNGSSFQIGKDIFYSALPGEFNVYNILAVIALAKFLNIQSDIIKKALSNLSVIRGRAEKIEGGQNFDVVVDYAHTPDSLRAIYKTYLTPSPSPKLGEGGRKLICVLGNTGGGRDTWKRPEMGKIADEYCDQIILTNEDPYDEDPLKIVGDMKVGIKNKPAEIIMDRRLAIKRALELASKHLTTKSPLIDNESEQEKRPSVTVLITGKGTDPYIMGPNGTKEEWDDARVVREELDKIFKSS